MSTRPGESSNNPLPVAPTRRWRWFFKYVAIFTFLWWILSEGDQNSWLVGLPSAVAAAGLSAWLAPDTAWRFHWTAIPSFLWMFVKLSVEGGFDVAKRALSLRSNIDPGMLEFETLLPAGTARVVFVNSISLCPGTVSANLEGDIILIHVLDTRLTSLESLRKLEYSVGRLFGCSWIPLSRSKDQT